jgi:hypothetical protein
MNKSIILAAIALVVSGVTGLFVIGQSSQSNRSFAGLSERDIKGITLDIVDDATFRKDIILKDGTFCIDFYATSTATQNKMIASTTATIEGTDGVITFGYGSCQ